MDITVQNGRVKVLNVTNVSLPLSQNLFSIKLKSQKCLQSMIPCVLTKARQFMYLKHKMNLMAIRITEAVMKLLLLGPQDKDFSELRIRR